MSLPETQSELTVASPFPFENACIVALALASVLLVTLLNLTPLHESDFWIQVKVGEVIRETGSIPDTVLFAANEAADFKFVAHEWLTSVALSYVHSAFGVDGAIVARGSLGLILFSLFYTLSFQVNRDPLLSLFVAIVSFLVISWRVYIRPEIISYILGLITLNLLHGYVRTGARRWLVGLPPLIIFWANCHGSFLLGVALPLFFVGGGLADDLRAHWRGDEVAMRDRVRRFFGPLVLASLAMLLAALINPFGWGLFAHVIELSGSEFIRENIQEWKSVFADGFRGSPVYYLYFAFALFVLDSLVRRAERLPIRLFLMAGLFLIFSINVNRHIAWFAIVGSYALAHALSGATRLKQGRGRNAAWLTVLLLCASAVTFKLGNVVGQPFGFGDRSPLSMNAIGFIRHYGYSGNVFNSYGYGGKLAYHLYPKIRISIDDRIDAYGEDYYRDYQRFEAFSPDLRASPEEFVEYFVQRELNLIVLDARAMSNWFHAGSLGALEEAGWEVVYKEPETYILQRREG